MCPADKKPTGLRASSGRWRGTFTCARTPRPSWSRAEIGEALASELTDAGNACYVLSRVATWTSKPTAVKVLTLYAAKGLEFPIVVVGGFDEGTYPVAQDFDDADLFGERMRHERRLLYVGLTRAMRGLMLIVPNGCQHPALQEIDVSHWHVEEVG